MRLVCPHCAATYEVPPALLGGRRMVRCARCGRDWMTRGEPIGEAAAASAGAGGAPEAMDLRAAAPDAMAARARRSVLGGTALLRLSWAASVLVLAIGAWQAVAWRSTVMHAWPPSQRLYAALGLARAPHVDGTGRSPAR